MTGTIFLGASEYSVGEREPFVTVTFQRTGDTSGAVTINYATNPGTATEGLDYPDSDGSVVMAAGASSVTVNIPILNDTLPELTETFNVSIVSVDSGTLLFPRTANISILDDETPATDPAQPPLTSPYTVTTTSVVTGLTQPMTVEWLPGGGSTALVVEKAGVIKVVDMTTGLTKSTLLDIHDEVNSNADRGLMDIALHPDFANHPYLYAFYVVDPPGASTATGLQARDGEGNRYAYVVRYEVNTSGATPTIVAGSKTVMLGGAGQSFADISGNGALNFTDEIYSANRASNIDPVTGLYKENYIKVDSQSHAGGALAFGPDGMLYISTGDGSSFDYADPRTAGVQDVDSLNGKILRIDPLTGQGLADNPFAEANLNTNQSKVWELGLRNPYSMTFADDGRLFISETGWYSWEEINSGGAGANFGWPYFEGGDGGTLLRTPGYQTQLGASSFYTQVANGQIVVTAAYRSFSHLNADPGYQVSAIVGAGDVYTGNKYPAIFQNDYFFTDIVDGEIFSVDINDRTQLKFVTDIGAYGPVSFFQGPDGYLYFADLVNGRISRLNITDPNPPANAAPTVASAIADRATAEDAPFAFTVPANTFADVDDTQLTLSATLAGGGALPAWLTFNPATGAFSGTPGDTAVGTLQVMVTATDPHGNAVSDVFALTVTNVNDAPIVKQPIAQQSATLGAPFSFALPAATFFDADSDALTLSARLADGSALPSWLTFNAATRTFAGTPPTGSAGSVVVAVKATDPSGAAATNSFTINVGQNQTPIVANPIDTQAATTGSAFGFTLPTNTFSDDGAFTLSAKLASGAALPSWLSFNPTTGAFTGTPPTGSAGRVVVSVTATDGQGASVSDSFSINVAAGTGTPNSPPVVANLIADQTTAEEALFSFTLPANIFSDPNGDVLTRSATLSSGAALPSWLTFNAATGTFSGTPDDPNVGSLSVTVTARDPSNASVSDTFTLTVTPVNDAPKLNQAIADAGANVGAPFTLTLPGTTFTDVDNPTLTLSAKLASGATLPSWLTFNPATGTFSGTPATAGNTDITVTATDAGGKAVSDTFTVAVSAAPATETLYTNTAANQTLTGTSANDVFVLGAASTGYQWGPTTDGTGVVIWNAAGFDILFGFEQLRFTNKSVSIATQTGPVYLDDPDIIQHLTGKTTSDTFVIAGPSTAYNWGPTASGSGIVVWTVSATDDTYDILTGFETIRFSDVTVTINGTATATALSIETGSTTNFVPMIMANGGAETATMLVLENSRSVLPVGAIDIDGSSLSYTLTGEDAGRFVIDANGNLKLLSPADFENPNDANHDGLYKLSVTVSDGTDSDTQALVIAVGNVAGAAISANNRDNLIDGAHAFGGKLPGAEEDSIFGAGGDDKIRGLDGNDVLVGGAGNDKLFGGAGNDVLIGSAGNDRFVFDTAIGPGNVDVIHSFSHVDDTIALDRSVFTRIGAPGALSTAAFYAAKFAGTPHAHDANDRIVYNKVDGSLWYDADGDKAGGLAAVKFAVLDTHPANVAANDFMIVA